MNRTSATFPRRTSGSLDKTPRRRKRASRGQPGAGLLVILLASLSGACDESTSSSAMTESAEAQPLKADFDVGPQTKGALFTWVDDEGSFQLTEDPASIPPNGREQVRVVVDGHPPGSPDYVYVANLNEVDEGRYALSSMPRSEWESIGKRARDERIAALQPSPMPDAQDQLLQAGVDAIVYGADWCKPCHLAEDYLRSKGAQVVKKDIEEDPAAAREMQQVLKSAGMSGASIPVLNVGGTVLRGFSRKAIDSALSRARQDKHP